MHRRTKRVITRTAGADTAFTLIELLVVIAIIAILSAILFPVFAQARAKARQSACLSNQKQVGIGIMMYAQDYDETLPGNSSLENVSDPRWPDAMTAHSAGLSEPLGWMQPYDPANAGTHRIWARDTQSYIKNLAVFSCPETKPRSTDGPCTPGANTCEVTDMPNAGNGNLLLNGIAASKPLAAMSNPADIIIIHEVRNHNRVAQEKPRQRKSNGLWTNFTHNYYDLLHSGGANLGFCDGHVKWQRRDQIRFAQFGAPPALNPGMPTHFSQTEAGSNALNPLEYRAEF